MPSDHDDPLVLLRKCILEGKPVSLQNQHVEMDGKRIPREERCWYKVSPTAKAYLDIGSLWYMWQSISTERSYTPSTAKKNGFSYIGVAGRSDLLDFLRGRLDELPGKLQAPPPPLRKRRREDDRPPEDLTDGHQGALPSRLGASNGSFEVRADDVKRRVRPAKDFDTLVRSPGRTLPNVDLILTIASEEARNWNVTVEPRKPAPTRRTFVQELEDGLSKDLQALPIILVPCSKTAPVNLLNAKDILETGTSYEPDLKKLRYFESTRPEQVYVNRSLGGRMWTFQVVDTPRTFTKGQWLRVVAVITDASDWQFKGWPFESLVDLFTSVKGVFFKSHGVPAPLHVKQWRVMELELPSREFPHRISAVRDLFWREVEGFLNSYRVKKFCNDKTLDHVVVDSLKVPNIL